MARRSGQEHNLISIFSGFGILYDLHDRVIFLYSKTSSFDDEYNELIDSKN